MNSAGDLAAGLAALDGGKAAEARTILTNYVANRPDDARAFLGIARACRALRDDDGATAAIDRLLQIEPYNLYGLIYKADYFAARGDGRSASSHYGLALRSAPKDQPLPPDLQRELGRAQEMCARYAKEFEAHLLARMAASGYDAGASSRRFSRSVDMVLGRKKPYVQQPLFYYFPELPQIQFYEREQFPWLAELERATPQIREELLEVLQDPGAFVPYVQGDPNRPRTGQAGLLNNPNWSAFYLWKNGEIVAENAARCPNTMRALQAVPLNQVPKRSPSVIFSLLRPRIRIPPHHGFVNTRLICHLPLIVPPGCGFRVGNDVREWVEGKAWLFDDTIEHEAWNDSDQTRVILLLDIWRPELTAEERQLVTSLFTGIDAYGGVTRDWTM